VVSSCCWSSIKVWLCLRPRCCRCSLLDDTTKVSLENTECISRFSWNEFQVAKEGTEIQLPCSISLSLHQLFYSQSIWLLLAPIEK
jgi:hypothetical protein